MGSSRTNMPTVAGGATSGEASNTEIAPNRRSLHLVSEGWENFSAALMYYFRDDATPVHWIIEPELGFCLSHDTILDPTYSEGGVAGSLHDATDCAYDWLVSLNHAERYRLVKCWPNDGSNLTELTGFQMNTRYQRLRTDQDILEIKPAWV